MNRDKVSWFSWKQCGRYIYREVVGTSGGGKREGSKLVTAVV